MNKVYSSQVQRRNVLRKEKRNIGDGVLPLHYGAHSRGATLKKRDRAKATDYGREREVGERAH